VKKDNQIKKKLKMKDPECTFKPKIGDKSRRVARKVREAAKQYAADTKSV
jgi:hypothetical protein